MFTRFILDLRQAGVPASITEYLALMGAMQAGVADYSVEDFYFLSRAALVKDERHLDRFDQVFATCFKGLEATAAETPGEGVTGEIPAEWLRRMAEKLLTAEERAQIEALGGFDKLMDTLRQRLAEQQGRHQGGSKWIGTGGHLAVRRLRLQPRGRADRPGVQPPPPGGQGVGQARVPRPGRRGGAGHPQHQAGAAPPAAVCARSGAATELDLPGTIRATAHNAGSPGPEDAVPERHNAVRVLLFLDVGGSMDDHVRASEELFSAARSEFRQLAFFYFHNCPYERVWTDNRRRAASSVSTAELLRTYGAEYRAIFVGDATMSPYEIAVPGGSVEHWNAEPGSAWIGRMTAHWRRSAWLNPVPQEAWGYTQSLGMVRTLLEDRMFPLTPGGIEQMTRALVR